MATITDRQIVQTLLDNDGIYPGDPQCCRVYEYEHINDEVMWAVFYNYDTDDMASTPFALEYRLLWDRERGHLTPVGILDDKEKG